MTTMTCVVKIHLCEFILTIAHQQCTDDALPVLEQEGKKADTRLTFAADSHCIPKLQQTHRDTQRHATTLLIHWFLLEPHAAPTSAYGNPLRAALTCTVTCSAPSGERRAPPVARSHTPRDAVEPS